MSDARSTQQLVADLRADAGDLRGMLQLCPLGWKETLRVIVKNVEEAASRLDGAKRSAPTAQGEPT